MFSSRTNQTLQHPSILRKLTITTHNHVSPRSVISTIKQLIQALPERKEDLTLVSKAKENVDVR